MTRSRLLIASLSLVFIYLFFFEYLPPFERVHIPYDLQGFHYPLNDYAYRALRHGRAPEWDPTIYCGMSFVGNIQAALFYPPAWILYLLQYPAHALSYLSLEMLVIAHIWLALILCYAWLRYRRLEPLACAFGAAIFAISGYPLLQLQHLGLVCAYSWIPLALLAIDQSIDRGSWRPLWKLSLAIAFAFFAGYPPTWVAICVCVVTYAAARSRMAWRRMLGVIVFLAISILVSMVQLLPAAEAAGLKEVEPRYGAGFRDILYFIPYLSGNHYDFSIRAPVLTNRGYDYLYLGAAAFLGLLWCGRARLREMLPFFAIAAVSAIAITNPFNLVWSLIRHSPLLSQMVRDWYFLVGITLAAAPLAALGADAFLRRKARPGPRWVAPLLLAAIAVWSTVQLLMWRPKGPGLPVGWPAALISLVTLVLLWLVLSAYRGSSGRARVLLAVGALLAVGVDYKVFGTSLRVNASRGAPDDPNLTIGPPPGMNLQNYRRLLGNPEYRAVFDAASASTLEFRHLGLSTAQGFDPLLSHQYKAVVGSKPGEWLIDFDPRNKELLSLLGIRWMLSFEGSPRYSYLVSDPDFSLLQPSDSYFKVFEFVKSQPPYRWERDEPGSSVRATLWSAQHREFAVNSGSGGRFVLIEQYFPGWEATIDGRPAPVSRWDGAFQSVLVPAGAHEVRFRFHSRSLPWGAAISALSLMALAGVYWFTKPRGRAAGAGV